MPSIHELSESKYLRKEDVEKPVLATMDKVEQRELDGDNGKEKKWVLSFKEESVKPMVLNKTNGTIIADITGSEEMNDWGGKQIVIFNDPSIFFAGKRTGGIRVRAPKNQSTAPKPSAPLPEDADEIPF